ncbi:MAG: permease prefix domain 1-containing protein [Treponema sp.]|nr:permease prefix domain 1-containing protein [Treponema sp.]
METIKNYLESMFRNLPNTAKVLKAKNELLQMMEDKYSELRREGKSENEAVATVIAEFGNLDEVAASLGIKEEIVGDQNVPRRSVSLEEIQAYLKDKFMAILLGAVGVGLFISCPVPVIFFGDLFGKEITGIVIMFVCIALGISFMIIKRTIMEQWRFLKTELCSIGPDSTEYITTEKRKFRTVYALMYSIGCSLCVCCFIPTIVIETASLRIADSLGPILLLLFVAIGVALIIISHKRNRVYQRLLSINSESTIGGSYADSRDKAPVYTNKTVRVIMSVYWPVITCIYLCVSFITFQWWITWIIWPIAGILQRVIAAVASEVNN